MKKKLTFSVNKNSILLVAFPLMLLTLSGCYTKTSTPKTLGGDTCAIGSSRSAADYDIASIKDKKNIVPVLILGSGPAGQSAAVYAGPEFHTVMLRGNKPFGLLSDTGLVENWPGQRSILGTELMEKLQDHAGNRHTYFLDDAVASVDLSVWPFVVTTQGDVALHALAIIACTGAQPKELGIPGEKEYRELGGVSACAVCDAWRFKGKNVVIIGGGDSAVEEATQLATHVKSVTILVRKDRMRAATCSQDRLKGYPNVSVRYLAEPVSIIGNDKEVTGVEITNGQTREKEIFPTDGVFLAIGHTPNTHIFKGLLNLDDHGCIALKDRSQQTSVAGVFAAGDVADPVYRQAITSAGTGCAAALDAVNFLRNNGFDSLMVEQTKAHFFIPEQDNQGAPDLEPVHVQEEAQNSLKPPAVPLLADIETAQELETLIATADRPVVVDFYTQECTACKRMMPALTQVAQAMADSMLFVKVDLDRVEVAKQYEIVKIPCLLVFNQGVLVARHAEPANKAELTEFLSEVAQGAQEGA